jgi:hypothetical protein
MGSFKSTIDSLLLKEIRLNGRHFTWSNEQDTPTLTRIDRFLYTAEWELLFPACFLHSLHSLMLDHTPCKGSCSITITPASALKIFCTRMDGFQELIQDIWSKPVASTQPLKRLHIKLSRVAKAIKRWRKEKIGDTRLQLALVKEILLQLEAAQERRALTQEELELRRRLKIRSVGLAAIEKSRIRQKSRLTNIRCGDANTKLFHIRASSRARKNYIQCMQDDNGIAVAHDGKEKIIGDYFRDHLGSMVPRPITFLWSALGYNSCALSELEVPFTMEEIKETIHSMPGDKALGPDGFTGAFFKTCWETVKFDIAEAINALFDMNSQGFDLLNSANIVLLPKKPDAKHVTDYRPISLIHSIAKIFSKLLANRLAPLLDSLISKCQSAFIKKKKHP